jgi:L-ascorbate metabolism protein UlaG (beta-lactamase superfamily)
VLVSHAHVDHLGNATLNQDPNSADASCGATPVPTKPAPGSNAAEIAAAKHAAFLAANDLTTFVASKIQHVQEVSVSGCPSSGPTNEMVVPLAAACAGGIGYGAKRTLRTGSATVGVQVAVVSALHGNAVANNLVSDPLGPELAANGLALAPGTASGFIIKFTNGLTAYLSGDTGLTSDMLMVVRGYYRPDLVVMNIGDIFTTGPEEAAFAINELIRPTSVIPSHANEVATASGVLQPGTKTARFTQLVNHAAVIPPLSGTTMEFDGRGHCVTGCTGTSGSRRGY